MFFKQKVHEVRYVLRKPAVCPNVEVPYFANARGSALECAAALDVLVARGTLQEEAALPGKERLRRVVSMIVGLIRANSDYRVHEGGGAENCD